MESSAKPTLGVGLIGTGFMGKAHVYGFALAQRVFNLPFDIRFECIADQTCELAKEASHAFGFAHATGDWQTMLDDPRIDIIDITAPNALHKEMALAAIESGKHVYCEKPLAPSADDAQEMTVAAQNAGVCTQVGFNYLANPVVKLAREMIQRGDLGEIRSYRGIHAEDYMADASAPFTFRHDPQGGGALADLGSHALATAEFLLGPIARVLGDTATHITARLTEDAKSRTVVVDDVARAMVRFANGVSGTIEANWLATGRKMQHDFEVYGSQGALIFTQERLNELHWYDNGDDPALRGFKKIVTGPEHGVYKDFCVAPGHQIGFNELKAIEIRGFIESIAHRTSAPFDFERGTRIQRLVEAIARSAANAHWVDDLC